MGVAIYQLLRNVTKILNKKINQAIFKSKKTLFYCREFTQHTCYTLTNREEVYYGMGYAHFKEDRTQENAC